MKRHSGKRNAAFLVAAGSVGLTGVFAVAGGAASTSTGAAARNPLNPGYPTCVTTPLSSNPLVAQAQKNIAAAQASATTWTGPTTGPKAAKNKYIAIIEDDLSNPGDSGFGAGVQEAAKAIGWRTQIFNGGNSNATAEAAFQQAIASKPNGIATSSMSIPSTFGLQNLAQAASLGIAIVTRHGGAEPGTGASQGSSDIFWNIQPNTTATGRIAGECAVVAAAEYGKKAGIVIGTQNGFPLTNTKSGAIAYGVQHFGGTLLRMESYDFSTIAQNQPQYTSSDLQTFGSKLTAFESINDIYCDSTIPTLISEGYKKTGLPVCIAAGDGSVAAFERIRTHDYQIATMADPNELQGWIAVDQLNRAFHGDPPDTYNPPVHIVDAADVGNTTQYNPSNNYQAHYKAIWGVK